MIHCNLINNATYSLEERELLTSAIKVDDAIPHILLKTCNRTELYWGDGEISEEVIRHLYRVAAGLESSLVGERAIQGQLKRSYAQAIDRYKLSPTLNKLFQTAIYTGKRVRTQTHIAEGAISHSQVTVTVLRQKYTDLNDKIIGIIGLNKLTEDIVKFLASCGATNILLSTRNIEKAKDIAAKYDGRAMGLEHKASIIALADVLICATSAPHAIVKMKDMPTDKKMLIFDLAFPRDVEEEIGRLNGVELLNLEDIESLARENISLREEEVYKAEQIIEEEINNFYRWLSFSYKRVG